MDSKAIQRPSRLAVAVTIWNVAHVLLYGAVLVWLLLRGV